MHSFDFECQVCQRKEKVNPNSNTHTVLWWLQPTTEMGLASRFETYLTAQCTYQIKKKVGTIKHKNKNDTSISLPRYQRVRPKYGQSALHLSSGRKNKQALRGAHKTLHPAGIAFSGLTAWGLNPHKGLRL